MFRCGPLYLIAGGIFVLASKVEGGTVALNNLLLFLGFALTVFGILQELPHFRERFERLFGNPPKVLGGIPVPENQLPAREESHHPGGNDP